MDPDVAPVCLLRGPAFSSRLSHHMHAECTTPRYILGVCMSLKWAAGGLGLLELYSPYGGPDAVWPRLVLYFDRPCPP
ncbi:hypothetical protein D7V97_04935 [Corallococcus sp. CA053C]|nr:hypothetical protein D7V97_04935 [Corallococcus sp. CA053C]